MKTIITRGPIFPTLCLAVAVTASVCASENALAKTKAITTTTTTTSTVHTQAPRKRKIARANHSKNSGRNYMINTIQEAARTK